MYKILLAVSLTLATLNSGAQTAQDYFHRGAQFYIWNQKQQATNEIYSGLKLFPDDPPRFLARTPHGYHDTALIRSELEDAGFSGVMIETRAEQSRAASARLPAVAYCQGTPLRNEIDARDARNGGNQLCGVQDC